MLMCINQLFKGSPCVATHKFIRKINIAFADSLQELAHLCFHFNVEAIQAIKIKQDMEIWHCLKM